MADFFDYALFGIDTIAITIKDNSYVTVTTSQTRLFLNIWGRVVVHYVKGPYFFEETVSSVNFI